MKDQRRWRVGDTSAFYESGHAGPGTVSSGVGDHGGVSYGTHQMATKTRTVHAYLRQSRFGEYFAGLTPGSTAFSEKWAEVARDHTDFGTDQHDFIRRTHADPVMRGLQRSGIALADRGPAVQDMIWSIAVQHGSPLVIERGLRETYGDRPSIELLSDREIVSAVLDSKLRHVHRDFEHSSLATREGVERRIVAEKAALLHLDRTGESATRQQLARFEAEAASLSFGSPTARVIDLQQRLGFSGIHDGRGERLSADGIFTYSTAEAVRSFQSSVGIPATGKAGPLTMYHLDQQVSLRRGYDPRPQVEPAMPTCRLDDRSHPDHAFYNQIRAYVADIDRRIGRQPDQYTDNLASALTVQARADGMADVSRVTLSDDQRWVWASHREPDTGDVLHSRLSTEESTTRMEDSAVRWPDAMRQFEEVQQRRIRQSDMAWGITDPGYPAETRRPVIGPNDPRHPDNPRHELYKALEERIPDASAKRLLQFTAACHENRIGASNLTGVYLDEESLTIGFNGKGFLTTPAVVDLNKPSPPPDESIAAIEKVDQWQAQLQETIRAQQMSRSGPSL